MAKNSLNKRIFTLNCNGRMVVIERPVVMGIINVTPDSFYSGSRVNDPAKILRAKKLVPKEGKDLSLRQKKIASSLERALADVIVRGEVHPALERTWNVSEVSDSLSLSFILSSLSLSFSFGT